MKKSIAIIGLSRFGLNLVQSFSKLSNVDIIAIDKNKEAVEHASEIIPNAFIADSTDEVALKELGFKNVDHAIIAIGQDNLENLGQTIMTVLKLKTLGVSEITARVDDGEYAEVLKLVGATNIVSPLFIASERIANKIAAGNVVDYFNIKSNYDVFELKLPPHFKPLPVVELDSRSKFKINILLIERGNELITPDKETVLQPNDEIFIFGDKKNIRRIADFFNVSE